MQGEERDWRACFCSLQILFRSWSDFQMDAVYFFCKGEQFPDSNVYGINNCISSIIDSDTGVGLTFSFWVSSKKFMADSVIRLPL